MSGCLEPHCSQYIILSPHSSSFPELEKKYLSSLVQCCVLGGIKVNKVNNNIVSGLGVWLQGGAETQENTTIKCK